MTIMVSGLYDENIDRLSCLQQRLTILGTMVVEIYGQFQTGIYNEGCQYHQLYIYQVYFTTVSKVYFSTVSQVYFSTVFPSGLQ